MVKSFNMKVPEPKKSGANNVKVTDKKTVNNVKYYYTKIQDKGVWIKASDTEFKLSSSQNQNSNQNQNNNNNSNKNNNNNNNSNKNNNNNNNNKQNVTKLKWSDLALKNGVDKFKQDSKGRYDKTGTLAPKEISSSDEIKLIQKSSDGFYYKISYKLKNSQNSVTTWVKKSHTTKA